MQKYTYFTARKITAFQLVTFSVSFQEINMSCNGLVRIARHYELSSYGSIPGRARDFSLSHHF
jgi:hypothetical protein